MYILLSLSFYSNLTAMCHEIMRLSESMNLSFHQLCDTIFLLSVYLQMYPLNAIGYSVSITVWKFASTIFYCIYSTNQIAMCNWRLPRLIKFAPLYITLYIILYYQSAYPCVHRETSFLQIGADTVYMLLFHWTPLDIEYTSILYTYLYPYLSICPYPFVCDILFVYITVIISFSDIVKHLHIGIASSN